MMNIKNLKLISLGSALLALASCGKTSPTDGTCAFIKSISENTVTVDIAEYITAEDTERMAELKLSEGDLPNGYHLHNPETDLTEYSLTENTTYNFIDWGNDFTASGENRNISSKDVNDFIKYINTYDNSTPGMPFFFDIEKGEVISITEIPMM